MSLYSWIVSSVENLKSRAGLRTINTHTLNANLIDSNSIVLDLGANVGQFSKDMVDIFSCTCYAVEAVPDVYSEIPDLEHIKKYNFAISDKNEPYQLFLSNNRECHSYSEEAAATYGIKENITVQGVTLESFLDKYLEQDNSIDLLKVDIEGGEEDLINSTSDETLKRFKQITIEFHDFVPGLYGPDFVLHSVKRLERIGFFCVPFSYTLPATDTCDFWLINKNLCKISLADWARFQGIKILLNTERTKSRLSRRFKAITQ